MFPSLAFGDEGFISLFHVAYIFAFVGKQFLVGRWSPVSFLLEVCRAYVCAIFDSTNHARICIEQAALRTHK